MAQIIKHRRGSVEALSAVTSSLQKGEIILASGSSNLTVTNGSSLVFAVPENGQVQATNRFLMGDSAPNTFAGSTYNGMVKGVPYYASGSSTLYLLGTDGNDIINLVGNIQPFSTSVDSRLDSIETSLGGGGGIGTRVSTLESHSIAVNAFTASQEAKDVIISAYTASMNTFSASVNGHIADLNTKTGSFENKFTTLSTYTASVNGHISDINTYTSSLRTAFTASGTNVIFSNDVTIPGNLIVTGTTTAVSSTTIQLGDNIIELNGTGVANGGLLVKDPTAPNMVSGSLLWDSTNDYWKGGAAGAESKFLREGGDNVFSSSVQTSISGTFGYDTFSGSIATSFSGSDASLTSLSASVSTSFSASATDVSASQYLQNVRINQLASFTGSYATTGSNVFVSSQTISGSLIVTDVIQGTGSIFLQPDVNDARYFQIYNTAAPSGNDIHFKGNADFNYFGDDTNYLKIDDSAQTITITGVNGVDITGIGNVTNYSQSVDMRLTASVASVTALSSSISASQFTYSSSVSTSFSASAASVLSLSTSVDSRLDVLEGTGTIQGVGTTNEVTFQKVTTTGDVVVGGDLVVQGNTVTLNTATLIVEDKLISLASGSTNAATANGAGIEVLGANATFTYDSTPNAWTANIPISASAVTASVNVPGFGTSKRMAFRSTTGNLDFIAAPTTVGDIAQWDGTNFVMSNVIDGGTY
jgi:hypothetical protein